MLRNIVKAAEVSHLTDARYFAAWEVAYLGFPIGTAGISLPEVEAIRAWIEGPQIVGEWSPTDALPTAEDLATYRLDALQLSQIHTPMEIAAAAQIYELPIWVEMIPAPSPTLAEDIRQFLEARKQFADCFVLNFAKAGIQWAALLDSTPITLQSLQTITANYPILLEISGTSPSSALQALPALAGFSVRGGEEEKVGFKDFDELADFFEDLVVES